MITASGVLLTDSINHNHTQVSSHFLSTYRFCQGMMQMEITARWFAVSNTHGSSCESPCGSRKHADEFCLKVLSGVKATNPHLLLTPANSRTAVLKQRLIINTR